MSIVRWRECESWAQLFVKDLVARWPKNLLFSKARKWPVNVFFNQFCSSLKQAWNELNKIPTNTPTPTNTPATDHSHESRLGSSSPQLGRDADQLFQDNVSYKVYLHMQFQANGDGRNVVWCQEKRAQFICGSLQIGVSWDLRSWHWCLSGSASEDGFELPQPAIYTFQSEHSWNVFMLGCSALYVSVWLFSCANNLGHKMWWYIIVCLPGEHQSNVTRRSWKEFPLLH